MTGIGIVVQVRIWATVKVLPFGRGGCLLKHPHQSITPPHCQLRHNGRRKQVRQKARVRFSRRLLPWPTWLWLRLRGGHGGSRSLSRELSGLVKAQNLGLLAWPSARSGRRQLGPWTRRSIFFGLFWESHLPATKVRMKNQISDPARFPMFPRAL